MRALVAWRGGLFLTEGVVCVGSISNVGRSVCGCMCVCTHTYTHTAGYSDLSPGVVMRHLQCPKKPDGLNLDIYVFVYVYRESTLVYVYARRQD